MKLSQLIQQDFFFPPEWDREFNHLATDSRDIKKGDVFVAVQGSHVHGETYIAKAIEQGAVAVLAQGEQNFRAQTSSFFPAVPVFYIPQVETHLHLWLHRRYSIKNMQLTAVTGTNGKSSVSQYIAQLLTAMQHPCALLGTLGNGLWPELKETRNTTADLNVILRELSELAERQVHYGALEVSSHGLAQQRVVGLHFKVAVFTNLTQDHLDYHGTMANYFANKRQLFTSYQPEISLINIDDDYGQKLIQDPQVSGQKISYGAHADAQVRYQLLALDANGMHAELHTPWGVGQLVLPLIGEFNLANACAAIAALAAQGLDFTVLCEKARHLVPVAGRMELYIKPGAPMAVVDFAHTPAALINVLNALKPWQRQLTTVFGCGGDRDRTKRPLMLNAVLELSDHCILTDDNPRHENPAQIFADVLAGKTDVICEHDRTLAITQAIRNSPSSGIVLIAGKGHEGYQDIQGVKHPYSDAQVLFNLGYQRLGGSHD